jgi:hypothetical protein
VLQKAHGSFIDHRVFRRNDAEEGKKDRSCFHGK